MPDKDETAQMDMEIFAAGKWNGDVYTDKDLSEIVSNFNDLRDQVKPFLKLGGVDPHKDLVQQPAIGWIDALRIENSRLIATVKDIPKIVFEAIKRKLYRRVSSEIYQGYQDGDGKRRNLVLRAVALLGASVPAVSTLKDLTTYLTEALQSERVLSFDFDADENRQLKIATKEESKIMNNDFDKTIKEFEDKLAVEAAARVAAEERAAKLEGDMKAFAEAEKKKTQDSKIAEIVAFCEDAVKAGKLPPFIRDRIFPKDTTPAGLLSFSEQDDSAVLLPFEVLKAFVDGVKGFDFSEKGEAGDPGRKKEADMNPGEILDSRAKELLAAKKVSTYSEAMREALASDPDLAAAYAADPGKPMTVR